MKNAKILHIVSNILMIAGGLIGLIALYLIFSARASLPAGVCPIDNHRPLLYTAIGILVLSLALSFIADWLKKKEVK